MDDTSHRSTQPVYQIKIEGTLNPAWSDWFEELSIVALESGDTLLAGPIADQAALYGVLWKLRDLNLKLVSVFPVERDAAGPDAQQERRNRDNSLDG